MFIEAKGLKTCFNSDFKNYTIIQEWNNIFIPHINASCYDKDIL